MLHVLAMDEMGQNPHVFAQGSVALLSKMPLKSLLPNLHFKSLLIIYIIICFAVFAFEAYPSGEVHGSYYFSALTLHFHEPD